LILPERTAVCSVVICSRPLRRRDDKQNDQNKYGQQNRQGDWSTKSGQNPNQTLGQQTQNPNQGGQQSGGQQRDLQRRWKRTANFDEQSCLAGFFRLPIRLLRHFPFSGARRPSVHALRGGSYGTSIFHSSAKPRALSQSRGCIGKWRQRKLTRGRRSF